MNDHHIEDLLRSLRPSPPSAELVQRVDRDLELAAMFRDAPPSTAPAKRTPWHVPVIWAALGAAAAVLVMTALPPSTTSGSSSSIAAKRNPVTLDGAKFLPVSTSREWVGVEDQGIQFVTPDSPERQLRVRSLQRHQWVDPRDGAEYTVEEPVINSVKLPVKFQ